MIINTKFNANQNRMAGVNTVIIKFTYGSNTILVSDIDMNLTDGHVYPLLNKANGVTIVEEVNLFTKNWRVGDVRLELSNAKFKIDSSGNWITLSDEICDVGTTGIYGADVNIYFLSGNDVASLSDCLLKFVGTVVEFPIYDEIKFKVRLFDKSRLVHTILPMTYIKDLDFMSDPYPSTYINPYEKAPVVFGKFTQDYDEDTGDGLAIGVPYYYRDCIVSDKPLNAFTNFYFWKPQIPDLCLYVGATFYTSYSTGYGRCDANGASGMAYLYADSAIYTKEDYYFPPAGNTNVLTGTNHANAIDKNKSSYSVHTDSWDNQFGTQESFSVFNLPDYASGDATDYQNGIGKIQGTGYIDVIAKKSSAAVDAVWAQFIYDNDGAGIDYQFPSEAASVLTVFEPNMHSVSFNTTDGTSYTNLNSFAEDIGWHFLSGHVSPTGGTQRATILQVHSQNNIGGNNIRNDSDMHEVYFLRVRIPFVPNVQDISGYWAECEGQTYGTWIDGRSSNYSSGTVIEDPAGIVEAICRTYLGLATVDINESSFIAAENTDIKHRINLHKANQDSSDVIIRKICEQSTFAFYYSGAGKAKLIPLNEISPGTDRTIPFSHIKKGFVKVSKTDHVSDIKHHSRYRGEYDEYADYGEDYDATARTFGVKTFNAKWDYISGTTVGKLVDHLVDSFFQGFWSRPRNIIEFETVGFTNADLELGDWIELDDATVDSHFLLYGASWSGRKFVVYNLQSNINGTKIEAMEVGY